MALLAATAAAGWYVVPQLREPAAVLELPSSGAKRAAHQQCVEGALLVHDVRWAAACMTLGQQGRGDGFAECELPDAQAAQLYAQLQDAEQSCMAEAVAAGPS